MRSHGECRGYYRGMVRRRCAPSRCSRWCWPRPAASRRRRRRSPGTAIREKRSPDASASDGISPAADTAELATFRYAIYVDGARSELADVTCGSTAGAGGFACSGRLPAMSVGTHTLELAVLLRRRRHRREREDHARCASPSRRRRARRPGAAAARGQRHDRRWREARRRDADRDRPVTTSSISPCCRTAASSSPNVPAASGSSRREAVGRDRSPATGPLRRRDPGARAGSGCRTAAVTCSSSTRRPARSGSSGIGSPAARSVDRMALDPRRAGVGQMPRLRCGSGRTASSTRRSTTVAAATRRRGLSEWSGKILRLNTDGGTPDDQPAASPVFWSGLRVAARPALDAGRRHVVDGGAGARRCGARQGARHRARTSAPRRRSARRIALPQPLGARALAFHRGDEVREFRGDLFIAASDAGYLLRIRFDPGDPHRSPRPSDCSKAGSARFARSRSPATARSMWRVTPRSGASRGALKPELPRVLLNSLRLLLRAVSCTRVALSSTRPRRSDQRSRASDEFWRSL